MASPWLAGDAVSDLWRLGIALAIGLIVGAERERRKGEGPDRAAAGIRTFAVVAALGGVASLPGATFVAVGGLFVGGAAIAAYALGRRSNPGLTTEILAAALLRAGAPSSPAAGPDGRTAGGLRMPST